MLPYNNNELRAIWKKLKRKFNSLTNTVILNLNEFFGGVKEIKKLKK